MTSYTDADISISNTGTIGADYDGTFLPTISIVFDSSYDEISEDEFLFYDICENSINNQKIEIIKDQGWLIDPIQPINALRRLRVLKQDGENDPISREDRSIEGRETGVNLSNISLDQYNDLKMRRKTEVLKHKQNRLNSHNEYSYMANKKMSPAKLKRLREQCSTSNKKPLQNLPTKSGIIGDRTTSLYLDTRIPYYPNI